MNKKPPLLRLVLGNLSDAMRLGLIDGTFGGVETIREGIESGWPSGTSPQEHLSHFQQVMTHSLTRLDRAHRPLRSVRGSRMLIATVMNFGKFARRFESQISAPKVSDQLRSRLGRSAGEPGELAVVASDCLEFSFRFGLGGLARRIRASEVIGAGRHTWVSPSSRRKPIRSAQHWRDRLGLIHVQTAPSPKTDDALVKVEFIVEPTRERIDRLDWKTQVARLPHSLWVIRPTVVHGGNQRFVQAHDGDAVAGAPPKRFGMTRDLASDKHLPGEREMLLVCGTAAEITFSAVELLEGPAGELPGRDNTDECFVDRMAEERGW